jgi:hypothetical protein
MTRLTTLVAIVLVSGASVRLAQQTPAPRSVQTQTDEYVRYDLLAPETAAFKILYEVSATTSGARSYVDPILKGSAASDVVVTDMMTGAPLKVATTAASITVTLARPIPANGQGRLRIEKTYKDAGRYHQDGDLIVFSQPLGIRRTSVVLPPGFALVACNVPSQVLSEDDGRIMISFMNQAPGDGTLVVQARAVAEVGAAAAPKPLTNARSWEASGQGATERARLTERAHQDRDIVYFLKEPSTNAFSLYHDYTESRPGTDKYLNVVRTGSRVSNTSAYILDTGEALTDETLRGQAITDAKIDIGQPVTPDTEVVVVHFAPVKAGQSVRLRISETYTAPQSYRLDGADLVFERNLGRARNSVVLPAGWYLTASAIPAVVRETPDKLVRLDFVNGRPEGIDVFLKARRSPARAPGK